MATISITGKYFTWYIRHLWFESNEVKAVKLWFDTFPDLQSAEHLNEYFIPVVSGKKKFTGTSSGQGFDYEDDDQPCWDPDQSGIGDASHPLLDSWEDVILLKKTNLYVADLELQRFRIERRYPSSFEHCCNARDWEHSIEENKTENVYRKRSNDYWTELRNLSIVFATEIYAEMLPSDDMSALTGPSARNKTEISVALNRSQMYQNIINYLKPIKEYFDKKYGEDNLFVIDEDNIKTICGIDRTVLDAIKIAKESIEHNKIISEYKKIIGNTDPFKSLDVHSYVAELMKEKDRGNNIESEDIITTKWTSGFIDTIGNFYGCTNLNHIRFAEDLCIKLNFKKEDDETNASHILDEKGWIKVSMNRFFWESKNITDSQKNAIRDYMAGKQMFKAQFNTVISSEEKMFEELFN
jgi:hypothetical protein